jgi:NAD(P)-dependent dehydrogenase (short-subunit alcohol dehydrogenase family)
MQRLQGKVALVTGGAGGIGSAAAGRFAEEGASVVVADVDLAGAEKVAAGLCERGFDAIAAACDQTKPEDVEALFAGPLAVYDRLDVCVANAGWGRVDPFLDLSLKVWRRHIDINLTGTFLIGQAAARRMVECGNGGSIVVTSSSGAVTAAALFAAYSSAKAALNMLVTIMAAELGAFDIRVNAVMPGVTETAMTKSLLETGAKELVEWETPLGRTGRPVDIADTVLFLASDESRYVTGQSVLIDGGAGNNGINWFTNDNRVRGRSAWRLRHEVVPVAPVAEEGS